MLCEFSKCFVHLCHILVFQHSSGLKVHIMVPLFWWSLLPILYLKHGTVPRAYFIWLVHDYIITCTVCNHKYIIKSSCYIFVLISRIPYPPFSFIINASHLKLLKDRRKISGLTFLVHTLGHRKDNRTFSPQTGCASCDQ